MTKVVYVVKETRHDLGSWRKRVDWTLLLACGHAAERSVTYRGKQWQQAPCRAQCAECQFHRTTAP